MSSKANLPAESENDAKESSNTNVTDNLSPWGRNIDDLTFCKRS